MIEHQEVTGFQSPCAEYAQDRLSLDIKFIKSPSSTFFARCSSNYNTYSIKKDDLLLVDRSLEPVANDLVVLVVDREFYISRYLRRESQKLFEHKGQIIEINHERGDYLWGVISSVHRQLR